MICHSQHWKRLSYLGLTILSVANSRIAWYMSIFYLDESFIIHKIYSHVFVPLYTCTGQNLNQFICIFQSIRVSYTLLYYRPFHPRSSDGPLFWSHTTKQHILVIWIISHSSNPMAHICVATIHSLHIIQSNLNAFSAIYECNYWYFTAIAK